MLAILNGKSTANTNNFFNDATYLWGVSSDIETLLLSLSGFSAQSYAICDFFAQSYAICDYP